MPSQQVLDDRRPGLEPPRFRLGSLMWAFVVLGVVFALIGYFGSQATFLIVLLLLAILAHVAGNALGTQLRANGDTPLRSGDSSEANAGRQPPAATDFAPTTRLGNRSALGRSIVIATCWGTVLGALIGGVGLTFVVRQAFSLGTVVNVALGMLAAGVLGGIGTFMAASFAQVACDAFRQATGDPKEGSAD